MEIQTLIYIGILLIIILIGLNVYLSWDKIKLLINHSKDSKKYEDKVKNDLNKITKTIVNDLNGESKIYVVDSVDNKEIKNDDTKIIKIDEIKPIKSDNKPVKNDKNDNNEKKKITDIDKDIEKLNNDLKKLENEIFIEENKLLSSSKSNNKKDQKEVYHVKSNFFKKSDANKVCKGLFNSDIATKLQLEEESNKGAHWCNYGWTADNNAYYPLNKDTDSKTCSGKKGLNGGSFPNSDNYKFGINCFGIKPDENKYASLEEVYNLDSFNENEQKKLDKLKRKLNKGKIKLEPYNPNQWSKYSFKKDTITINNNTIITTTKTDKSKDPNSIKIEKNKIDAIINYQ